MTQRPSTDPRTSIAALSASDKDRLKNLEERMENLDKRMDQLLLDVGRILKKLSQQESAVCERKAEIPTLFHDEVDDALSDNVAFQAAIKDGISQSHD